LKACHKAKELKAWPSIYGDIAVTSLYAKDFDQAKRYLSKFLKTDVDPAVAFQIGRAFAFHDQALSAIERQLYCSSVPKCVASSQERLGRTRAPGLRSILALTSWR
jgi:hypothetical protein